MVAIVKELFPDDGLMLAVLSCQLESGALAKNVIEAKLAGIADKTYGIDPEGEFCGDIESERVDEAIRVLGHIEVNPSGLAAISTLRFDGEIYAELERAIGIDTGGEEDYYRLGGLTGIDQLTGLVDLDLDCYGYREADLDLSPLAGCTALETIVLSGSCKNVEVLERLNKLRVLDLRWADMVEASILEKLRARGVEVKTAD